MKSIILLMASSGIRIGVIPLLRLRNVEKVDSVYKIIVYEGTNEQYIPCVRQNAHLLLTPI